MSFRSKAAGHSVRDFLNSRVIGDWLPLRNLGLPEAQISSVSSSLNSCSTHWRMEEKGVSVYHEYDHDNITTSYSHWLEFGCGLGTELNVVSMDVTFNADTATRWGTLSTPVLHKGQMVLLSLGVWSRESQSWQVAKPEMGSSNLECDMELNSRTQEWGSCKAGRLELSQCTWISCWPDL